MLRRSVHFDLAGVHCEMVNRFTQLCRYLPMAFSMTIPMAVGTAPFQKDAAPSLAKILLVVVITLGKAAGLVCILTLTVSNGWPV